MINNYVKLFVRGAKSETYLFPFGDKGAKALKAAQTKRGEFTGRTCQLSTFAPSLLRGVPVVGEPIRALEIVEAA